MTTLSLDPVGPDPAGTVEAVRRLVDDMDSPVQPVPRTDDDTHRTSAPRQVTPIIDSCLKNPRASRLTETTDSKAARTRERILDAAAHVLSRKGYAGTRLSDVAEQAQIQAPPSTTTSRPGKC